MTRARGRGGTARVRALGPDDMDAVAQLETRLFSTPWSAETFRSAARGPGAVLLGVEDEDGTLLAYAVLWCFGDHGELSNIGVAPPRQGQGIGSRLLDEVLRTAASRGVDRLFLEVRESNARAVAMYRSRGFEPVGRRRAYYRCPREDAIVLMKRLEPPSMDGEAEPAEPKSETRNP